MSRVHAEFHLIDGDVTVKDFGSTNGTYLNGDVIRFASFEVRLVTQLLPGMDVSWARTLEVDSAPEHLLAGIQGLQELLDGQAVTAFFQSIVRVSVPLCLSGNPNRVDSRKAARQAKDYWPRSIVSLSAWPFSSRRESTLPR
jgi:hypothetical protein